MSENPIGEYRVMLTVDIEDYSSRTDAEQRVLQRALRTALDDAADVAELSREKWLVQLGGDGIFAVLPNGTDVSRLMDCFVRELDAGLGGYNRRRAGEAWTRMRLRLAIHAGLVHLDGPTGWPGQHAVLPARLRDSEPIRAALKACQVADLAVIVSADIYRDYITQGPGNPRPTEFRAVLAHVKQQSYTAHLFVPGSDVHAMGALAKFDAPSPPSATPAHPLPDAGAKPPADALTQSGLPSHRDDGGRYGESRAGHDAIGQINQMVTGGGHANVAGRDINHGAHYPRRRER